MGKYRKIIACFLLMVVVYKPYTAVAKSKISDRTEGNKIYAELVSANKKLSNVLSEEKLKSLSEIIQDNEEVFKNFEDTFPEKHRIRILELAIKQLEKIPDSLIEIGLNTNFGRTMMVDVINSSIYDSSNIKTSEIHIENGSYNDYRILFLADLQFSNLVQTPLELKEYIKDSNADILVLGGDIIDKVSDIDLVDEYLSNIDIEHKYYVRGNHEYYINERNRARLDNILHDIGFKDINNANIYHEGFNIIGIDDIYSGKDDIEKAYEGIDPDNKVNLVFTHNHDINYKMDELQKPATLILSGHTHGGQIQSFLVPLTKNTDLWEDQGHYSGEYEFEGTNLNYRNYTVNGLGGSGVALRLGAQQEGLIIQLSKGEPKLTKIEIIRRFIQGLNMKNNYMKIIHKNL